MIASACKKEAKVETQISLDAKIPNEKSSMSTARAEVFTYTGISATWADNLRQQIIDDPNLVKIIPGQTNLDNVLYAAGYQEGVQDAKAYINSVTGSLTETGNLNRLTCDVSLRFAITSVHHVGMITYVPEGYELQTGEHKSGVALKMNCSVADNFWYTRNILKDPTNDSGRYLYQLRFNNSYAGRTINQMSFDSGKYEGYWFSISNQPFAPASTF
ncbi:hypothetical protein [Pedobacter gandavensis]|uniref:hypothetical protein n=1 Tax=Pedobacter gandavensis TaxID=2679963 RepID=UPI00292F37B4|nr:hypothetical protein [Pedobacter gandavensis]